jgi:transcription elongation GreA/GreB family factor
MRKRYYLTRKGLTNLQAQLELFRQELHSSTKEMGESVKRDNDLRENPEYMQLQTKVSYELPNKISEIVKIMDSHLLIEDTDAIKSGVFDEVVPGTQVEVESADGHRRAFSILGYNEGNPAEDIISYLAPVATALLNKEIGDEIELMSNGRRSTYAILRIYRSPHLK